MMDTDSSSYSSHLKRYVWLSLLLLALVIYCICKLICSIMVLKTAVNGPVMFLIETGALAAVFLALLGIAALASGIRYFIKTIVLTYRITSRKEVRHNVPYKKTARYSRLVLLSILVIIIGLTAGIIVSHNFPYTPISAAETLAFSGDRPVMLKEIDPESWEKVQQCIESDSWNESIGYSADEYSNALFKTIINICTDTEDTVFRSNYYEARHEKIAAQFVKETLSYYIKQGDTIYDLKKLRPAETAGLDYAAYWEEEDGYQHVCLRVETVSYFGAEKLPEHLEVFTDDLI